MLLVLYSACIGSRTIVIIDEAIRALRRRRLATPPCVGWRIVIERKGPHARVFVGYHAICNGEKLSVVRKIYWVQLRLLARVTVLIRRWTSLTADSAGGGGYACVDGRSSSRNLATATGIVCFGGEARGGLLHLCCACRLSAVDTVSMGLGRSLCLTCEVEVNAGWRTRDCYIVCILMCIKCNFAHETEKIIITHSKTTSPAYLVCILW